MAKKFSKIALMGRRRTSGITETLQALEKYLLDKKLDVVIESETADLLDHTDLEVVHKDDLPKHADLIIVVGGDGSLLKTARVAAKRGLPVLGINRGRLGFLTDIKPDDLAEVGRVLDGHYVSEERSLLEATTEDYHSTALNDVVLLPGDVAHMIEFNISINDQFVCKMRADGLIIATPTGSTAYSLSGGGPILTPGSSAMTMVPMFPHKLTSRPIVVSSDCKIELEIASDNESTPFVSCDGQKRIPISAGGKIRVQKSAKSLKLIHPESYDYFKTLREKLHWQN